MGGFIVPNYSSQSFFSKSLDQGGRDYARGLKMYKVLVSNENETCVECDNSMLGPTSQRKKFMYL
jgi:hypothetical protein